MLATGLQVLSLFGARKRETKTLLTFCGAVPPDATAADIFEIRRRGIGVIKEPVQVVTLAEPKHGPELGLNDANINHVARAHADVSRPEGVELLLRVNF